MAEAEQLDPRIMRIGIEVNGQLKLYEGLSMVANGCKFANANQNECEVKITNVDRATRDYLQTETSPYNRNRTRKVLTVEAGRRSTGYALVFSGDIVNVVGSQPPDITLTIKCATGSFSKGDVVARSQPGITPLKNIAAAIAKDLGLSLRFEATGKNIANYSFTGGALQQVDQLCSCGGVNAYVDDKVLVVKNYNAPLAGNTRELSIDTGMVGKPQFTEKGIKVKMLFDNQTKLGSGLNIKSVTNPAIDGVYTVSKLGFELASREAPWYYVAECVRADGAQTDGTYKGVKTQKAKAKK